MNFHMIELPFIVIPLLLTTIFWLWMLRDCIYNSSLLRTQKVLWFLVVFFTNLPGAIVYFFIARSKRI